jgi:hypothetical protein
MVSGYSSWKPARKATRNEQSKTEAMHFPRPGHKSSVADMSCANRFRAADGDWETFIKEERHPSDFTSTVGKLPHSAAHLLNRLRLEGAPVQVKTAPWTRARKRAALRRGPHKLAVEYSAFLREEMAAMIQKGQWIILPTEMVEHLQYLQLSPLGVVPERDRSPW